jgi:hypothetical protein
VSPSIVDQTVASNLIILDSNSITAAIVHSIIIVLLLSNALSPDRRPPPLPESDSRQWGIQREGDCTISRWSHGGVFII